MNETASLLEVIKLHCEQGAADLKAVASALLSVEDKLDWTMKYELESLLKNYVIARAHQNPAGLASILDAFPLDGDNGNDLDIEKSEVQEALQKSVNALDEKVKSIIESSESPENFANLSNSVNVLVEASKEDSQSSEHTNNDNNTDNDDKSVNTPFKKKKKNSSERSDEKEDKDKEKPTKESLDSEVPNLREMKLPDNLEDLEEFRLSSAVTNQGASDGSVWRVRMIQQGHTASGRFFPDIVLREAMPLFEGTRSYANHPSMEFNGGDRPVENLVGWFDNVELKEGDGLYADWHVLANSGKPYLRDQLIELSANDKLGLVGLSLLGLGKNSFKRQDGKLVKYSESISYVRSVDLVDVPGAGGKIVESIRASEDINTRSEIMGIENMTVEELKEANPQLYEKMVGLSKEDKGENKQEPLAENVMDRLLIRESNLILDEALRESHLPQPMKDAVSKKFRNTTFDQADLDDQINIYRESAAAVAPGYDSPFFLPAPSTMINEEERMQAAMDQLFGLEVPGHMKDTPKLRGIREAYFAITGDYDMTWGAIPLDDRYREGAGSTPTAAKVVGGGTVTFANVLGTSVNRRLIRSYRKQMMWWEPFTTIVPLNDLKQQDRNRLESLGALSERSTGGAEYSELTWAEFVHTYTPTEYGNLVPIAQRAIVDDDLRALVRVSDELGRSAGITLNEYVSNLFTQNSGTGPTFQDVGQDGTEESGSEKLFSGSTTAAHNNSITGVLNRANFKDADQRIRTMVDKSQKRIGLFPQHLLIPHELREQGLQIQGSERVPDSANNAINIFQNTFAVIEVPQFTDVNNWYLLAGKDQLDMIEMGFLNGRRDPEMFVQADPQMGMAFTHDVINYKIRHRYGGGWLDYRGAVGSIVS
tara:strand:- start:3852 stop:6488 length:2637 start_codon:yes stop_codon:yes gene_type:complete